LERKPSEIIQDFLNLIEKSHDEFKESKEKVEYFNAQTYVWTHRLEDCKNKQERGRLSTEWQKELKQRRKEKDRKNMWEKIHTFGADANNKAFLKKIRRLMEEQKTVEEYLSTPYQERKYKATSGGANGKN